MDLNEVQITLRQALILAEVFRPHAKKIDRVGVFGSRAMNRARPNSDIDLVIYGEITQADQNRINTDLLESGLDVFADALGYDLIEAPALRRHIDQVARTLFTRADLGG